MFGDILFSNIPFSTFDEGTTPEPYARLWVNQCPIESDWENQDPNNLAIAVCHKDK